MRKKKQLKVREVVLVIQLKNHKSLFLFDSDLNCSDILYEFSKAITDNNCNCERIVISDSRDDIINWQLTMLSQSKSHNTINHKFNSKLEAKRSALIYVKKYKEAKC
ncbi:MAG: hypothetical protein ACRC23_02010 [Aeromonas jandaei]